jgi:magnesium transporter
VLSEAKPAIDELLSLLESGNRQKLRLFLNDQYPADLAEFFQDLDHAKRVSCFRLLDLDNASALLAELEPDLQRSLLRDLGNTGLVPIISNMSPDDAVDLLSELPGEEVRSIMSQLTDEEVKEDLQELMSFREDSAGGIMSTDYLALKASMSIEEALNTLRSTYKKLEEEIYDVYVVDDEEKLVGEVSLRTLLTAANEATVESQMETDIITVDVDTDQEEAAEKLGKYDLLTLPVVDSQNKLRGIITADDIIDVLQEEASEDMYQSSGIDITSADQEERLIGNIPLAFRARLPWLLVTLVIETGSASVITHFDKVIQQTVAAASFMPLLSGVTGSVATQSTCIMLRGSATGHIDWNAAWQNLWHELKVGLLLGATCGILISIVSVVLHSTSHNLGLIVGLSLFVTMTVGVFIGTIVPIAFHKIGIEPAHASGPLITSILDVCTMTIYLTIVHSFLNYITG